MAFWEHTSTGLAWVLTSRTHSAALPERMTTTFSNALNSMNTRLTALSVGTGRLGVKWPRSQAWVLDK
ncbi:hypothetical protein TNCV_114671 [Trichonephila clavipes]|nr:hypothetical protein TNCV_114671 [Trichonephila clavipes]